MPKESTIQKNCIDYLRQQGAYVFKAVGSPAQQRGTPDILACYSGYFLGLEIKADNGVTSQMQIREMERIEHSGGISAVIRSKEDLIELLAMLPERTPEGFKSPLNKVARAKISTLRPESRGKHPEKPKNGATANTELKKRKGEKASVDNGDSNSQSPGPATRRNGRQKAVPVVVRAEQGHLQL